MDNRPPEDAPFDFATTMKEAGQGSPSARQALFERYYPKVEGMVHRSLAADLRLKRPWIGAMVGTGDVVQEVFISVLGDLDKVQAATEASFVAFLSRVIKNRLIDSIRFHEAACRDGRRSEAIPDSGGPKANQVGPATQVRSAESLERYYQALESFSERERILLRGKLEGGLAFPELAQQLDYPSADAARKALYAAQARLLVLLRDRGPSSDQ